MISPLVAGILIGANSIVYVWCIMAAALFTASALTLLLAYETRGNLELVSQEA
jgi:predicted metal-binding membrane protein